MNGYYCLNCGEKLKQLSMNLSTNKYECPKCCTTWYRVRHIIIKWVEEKKEGSDIIVQILINGKDKTRKYDKFGSEIQYNITWDSDKPNKKYLTIFSFCEFALHSYDIWNSKDGDILERIQYHEKFNVITRDRFIFNKNRYWLQNK